MAGNENTLKAMEAFAGETDVDPTEATGVAPENPGPQGEQGQPGATAVPPSAEATVTKPPDKRRVWVFETSPRLTDTGVSTGYTMLLDPGHPGIGAMIDAKTGKPVGQRDHISIKWTLTTVPGPDGSPVPACIYATDKEPVAQRIMADADYRTGKIRMRPDATYDELARIEAKRRDLLVRLGRAQASTPAPPIQPREAPPAEPQIRIPAQVAR